MEFYIVVFLLATVIPYTQQANELETCSADQHNSQACQVIVHYREYQQVKCLAKTEIQTITQGKYSCRDDKATHCWYPDCQLRLTNLAFVPEIQQQCKCEEQSRDYCKNTIDEDKRRCVKLPQYESSQWATCKASTFLAVRPHTSACQFPNTHCWYPCQAETFGLESGNVNEDCECSAATHLASNPSVMITLTLIIYALSKFVV